MDAGNFYEAEGGEDRFSDEEAPLIAAPPPAADTQKPVPTTFSCKIAYNPEHGYWVAWLSDNACSGSSPQSALNNLLKHLGY